MRLLSVISLLFTVFALGCSAPVESPNAKTGTRNDYEVYSAYLSESLKFAEERPELLICSNTITNDSGENFIGKVPKRFHPAEVDQGLIESFAKIASEPEELSSKFNLPFDYQLVPISRLDELTGHLRPGFEREKAILDEFPNSTLPIYVSKVGYNDDGSMAMFFVARMGQDGRYVVMRKEQGKWKTEIERWSYYV